MYRKAASRVNVIKSGRMISEENSGMMKLSSVNVACWFPVIFTVVSFE